MKKNKKISKKTRENWRYLVTHFTPEYIETMTDKKEYVVGWGSDNKSFCYLVEVGTKELGEIRGANSSKFGLWYGTHGEDKEIKYRATKQHFNCSVNKAFEDIKIALAKLIRETRELNICNIILFSVHFCVFNSVFNNFNTDNLFSFFCC
jgi:hypothetical protein